MDSEYGTCKKITSSTNTQYVCESETILDLENENCDETKINEECVNISTVKFNISGICYETYPTEGPQAKNVCRTLDGNILFHHEECY